EVWRLLASMMSPDVVIREIKRQTDLLLKHEAPLQRFLTWCYQHASLRTEYKGAAIRAFFYELVLEYGPASVSMIIGATLRLHRFRLSGVLDSNLASVLRGIGNSDESWIPHIYSIDDAPRAMDPNLDLDRSLAGCAALVRAVLNKHFEASLIADALDAVLAALDRSCEGAELVSPALAAELSSHRDALSLARGSKVESILEASLASMIRHRDIGHDWGFSPKQISLLDSFYSANLLLIDCMKEARGLTNATRQHIEDTLLLPWDLAYPSSPRDQK
ncbi:MAG: hypothetical protein JO022_15680, partial [Acidobacteriaceae bacterium]|nr:hypothetical protein [Acidobacteriaceae bacterium]